MRQGSLLIPDDGNVNERERKSYIFYKMFLSFFKPSFFWQFWILLFLGRMPVAAVCMFPLGWISISKLLQIRWGCKWSSNSMIYANAWTCKIGKTRICNWKLHLAKCGKQVEEAWLVIFSWSVRWQPLCLEILSGNQSWPLTRALSIGWAHCLSFRDRRANSPARERSSKISRLI